MGCDDILSVGENKWVCSECAPYFAIREYNKCQVCGRIIYHSGKCRVCNSEKLFFDKGYSVYEYKLAVRDAIRRFKYRGMYRYGEYLGNVMARYAQININEKYDYVTAVPLYLGKYKKRGYNQAELLARIVAKSLGCSYKELLVRHTNTIPQSGLDKKQRNLNIKSAFSAIENVDIKDKSILIIDDIFTSGATINECSKVLKKNNALKVDFFALSCRSED